MVELNLDEKVVLKKSTSLLDGLKQKQGKLYITNERLIFEDTKNSSNNIYIQLSEIKSYRELKVFIKINNGFEFHLDNGIKYCFILFGKSILSKLEDVREGSIEKEIGVRHNWLPNILSGLLISWFVIIPMFTTIYSRTTDFVESFEGFESNDSFDNTIIGVYQMDGNSSSRYYFYSDSTYIEIEGSVKVDVVETEYDGDKTNISTEYINSKENIGHYGKFKIEDQGEYYKLIVFYEDYGFGRGNYKVKKDFSSFYLTRKGGKVVTGRKISDKDGLLKR